MKIRHLIFYFSLLFCLPIKAQLFQDNATQELIKESLNKMYNFNFIQAKVSVEKIRKRIPNHPVADLISAMIMEREFYPFEKNPEILISYKKLLEKISEKANILTNKNEKLFFKLASEGYLAGINADMEEYMTAIKHAKNAYYSVIESKKLIFQEKEFLYTSGLYNYLREAYGDVHLAVKPFMVIFQSGNKELGLKELNLGYKRSFFTNLESGFQLVYIYKKYENKPELGLDIAKEMHEKFPNNPQFLMQYIEVKLLSKKLDNISLLINQLDEFKSPYLQQANNLFKGLFALQKGEKKEAETYFLKTIKLPFEEKYTREYRGMAYLELAKMHQNEQNSLKKEYLNQAKKYCEYRRNKLTIEKLD